MCGGEIIIEVFGDLSPLEVSRRGSCVVLFGVFLPWSNGAIVKLLTWTVEKAVMGEISSCSEG